CRSWAATRIGNDPELCRISGQPWMYGWCEPDRRLGGLLRARRRHWNRRCNRGRDSNQNELFHMRCFKGFLDYAGRASGRQAAEIGNSVSLRPILPFVVSIDHCARGPTPTRSRCGARRLATATPTRLPRWGPRLLARAAGAPFPAFLPVSVSTGGPSQSARGV